MHEPRPFALTTRLLAAHGFAGRVLALPPQALGGLVQLLATRPAGSERWALQGRRADSRAWAPVVERTRAKSGPKCEACEGNGKCAQCGGIGCSVCTSSGKCSVCTGAGTVEAKRDDAPDSDEHEDGEESSSSALLASPVVRVVSARGLLAAEVTGWECGVMDGYGGRGGVVDRMAAAHADPQCVAIVGDFSGPGGDAMGCIEAATQLAAMREASGKPVLVWTSEATSAYYALACAAASPGGLFAAPSADLANVGTRTWHVDRSEANKMAGERVTHFGAPAGKILGNPDEPLSPEAAARIQRDIEESTARFVALVSRMRPALAPAAVLKLDADTRRGQAAVDEGLADGLAGSLAEVVALAAQRAQALAAPVVPSSAGGSPAPESDMPLSPAALAQLGLQPGASSDAISKAILAAGRPVVAGLEQAHDPLRALGAVALDAMGGGDAVDALVELPRRLARGATAPAVEVERDELRREKAWGEAVTAGAFSAGEVWRQVDGPDGKRSKAFTPMAAAFNAAYPDVPQLEARLARLPKLARAGSDAELPDAAAAAAFDQQRGVAAVLSPKWVALAERAKVDPVALARRVNANLGNSSEP